MRLLADGPAYQGVPAGGQLAPWGRSSRLAHVVADLPRV